MDQLITSVCTTHTTHDDDDDCRDISAMRSDGNQVEMSSHFVDSLTFAMLASRLRERVRGSNPKVCHYPRKKSYNRRELKPTKHHVKHHEKIILNIVSASEGFIGTLSMILSSLSLSLSLAFLFFFLSFFRCFYTSHKQ